MGAAVRNGGARGEPGQGGRHAEMFSARERFSATEWERLDAWLDSVYADFTTKVAAGRGLDREQVHEIARGRVWTGADAQRIGLVEELGGLRRAVELARAKAGLPSDAPVRRYPALPLVAKVHRPQNSEAPGALQVSGYVDGWGGFADLAAALRLPVGGPLLMPPLSLRLG
ncbi:MAG: S49 family peptidase [Mycobacteriales bacterium]